MEIENIAARLGAATPSTKEELQMMAINIMAGLDNGKIDALHLLKTLKMVEKLQELVKDKLTKAAVQAASRYPEKEIHLNNVVYTKMEAGTKYDYSVCGDSVINNILEQEALLKKEKEKRAKFLQGIDKSITQEIVDESTGEITSKVIFAPVKTSTSTVSVSFDNLK